MDSKTSHPLAKCKNYGVHFVYVKNIWLRCLETAWRKRHMNTLTSVTDTWGTHLMEVPFVVKTRRCLAERARASQFSRTVQQDGEPTSAPINNLHKLLRPEGARQLLAIPQLWRILITCTLEVSHWNMTTSLFDLLICQDVFDAQKAISFL